MNAGLDVRPRNSAAPTAPQPALVVDLEGGLLKTNLLLECVVGLLKRRPWRIFLFGCWLLKGRAYLKQQVARRVRLDVTVLPYGEELVNYLKARRRGDPRSSWHRGRPENGLSDRRALTAV